MNQKQTPLADALSANSQEQFIPFDVPGHKGNIIELQDFFGERAISLDKNSRPGIDFLNQPKGVISEAEALFAEAFRAKDSFFMVGGATSCVHAMIMSVCSPGDKLIIPRNAHVSCINSTIISGIIPVYADPGIDDRLGISLGTSVESFKDCIKRNTDAKAVFVINPTYYGICPDIKTIVELAHSYGMYVIVDEAHGTHFYFNENMPANAMDSGADLSAVSMHKTGGALTQSAALLSSGTIPPSYIRSIISLLQTTSASYLLLASLDIARKNLFFHGKEIIGRSMMYACKARDEINRIGSYYAFDKDILNGKSIYDLDPTKLSINTDEIGLTGSDVYTILNKRYKIQLEFGDIRNILAIGSVGDKEEYYRSLVSALSEISEKYKKPRPHEFDYEYFSPIIKMLPQKAFYSRCRVVGIRDSVNSISSSFVMCYPPGIPLLAPGELITRSIAEHITYAQAGRCDIVGLAPDGDIFIVDE
ncbi:MAG: aminotransferase class I/II-fold pyridoxal phosphate-dependent enzyme [Oscillospiraceae bacterium]|jgi:lysine decarboxylase